MNAIRSPASAKKRHRAFRDAFPLLLLAALPSAFCCEQSAAQDYQRLAPKTLPSQGTGEIALPSAPSLKIDPRELTTILNRLVGIRLVDKAAKIEANGARGKGLVIEGPQLLKNPAIETRLETFIGKPLSLAAMKLIAADIEQWYRTQGRPFVDVVFPEQDISTGVLQAIVTEFRVGKIRSEGNNWFADWLLESQVSLNTGDIIRTEALNDDIAWLNQNPFRQTTAVAEKGDVAGTTDIVLHTEDRFPLRAYASYDNTGVPAEGVNRWGLGLLWGDAFFLDQLIAYQFTSSNDFWSRPDHTSVSGHRASLAAHSLSWIIPLPWRDRLIFYGLYEQDRPNLGLFLNEAGVSWQTSFRYDKALPALGDLAEDLQFGFDFKRTNNNFAFGGFNISNSLTDVAQIPILYTLSGRDNSGQTLISNLVELSPGRLDRSNADAAFQPNFAHFGVPYASARFAYDDFTLSRVTRLPWDFSAITRGQGQLSTSNLLPSEAMDGGGIDSVRGYDERTASGSLGLAGTQEFRTPAFSPSDQLTNALHDWDGNANLATGDALQFDVFWDYGFVRDNRAAPGSPNGTTLMSIGCGAHYTLGRFIDFRVENGWQLRKAPGETKHESRLIFSGVIGD
jgi:hemolysin activation/secretion protein